MTEGITSWMRAPMQRNCNRRTRNRPGRMAGRAAASVRGAPRLRAVHASDEAAAWGCAGIGVVVAWIAVAGVAAGKPARRS